jgi:CPA2 family monovalent cation:H+ antiporter-2
LLKGTMAVDAFHILAAAAETGHTVGWIDDFGLVLAAAAVAVVVFHLLRWPVIFGYILAGILIGPHLFPKPLVEDQLAIRQISELGVIFLLFFIGLEFDLRRLQRVLGPALLGLVLQTLTMLYLAQVLAPLLGWNAIHTIFFGSLLAISSSMVTVRVLRDTGRLRDAPAQFTLGILILEDVLAVLLLVVLTGVAVTQTFAWNAAWIVIVGMLLFVVMVFLIGRTVVPVIWSKVAGGENPDPEAMTLMSVGLVMGVSLLALRLDFSPALGAFVAGTLFSSSSLAQRVENMNRSLHDVFTAVFFVAVGMQLDPALLFGKAGWILLVASLVILGKLFSCALGLCLCGQGGRLAFQAALPKAQIGEFSFIIAALGNSLDVLDERVTTLAYGVALVTILTTPVLTSRVETLYAAFRRLLPSGLIGFFTTYRQFVEGLMVGLGRSRVLQLIRRPVLQVVLYFLLITGVIILESLAARRLLDLVVDAPLPWLWRLAYWLAAGLLVAPFLFAVLRNLNAIAFILTDALVNGSARSPFYQARLKRMISSLLLVFFLTFLGLVFLSLAAPYLPGRALPGLLVLIVALAIFLLRGRLIRLNSQMELLFLQSFREDVTSREEARRTRLLEMISEQSPWEVSVEDLLVPRHAAWSGKRIRDLDLRRKFGVNILALGRRNVMVFDPVPEAPVFSGDRIVVTGSSEAIAAVREASREQVSPEERPAPGPGHFQLRQVFVPPRSCLDGQTLAGGRVRKTFGVTVIGVQREEKRSFNPGPEFLIEAGDILLVAGIPEKIEAFAEACGEKPLPAGGLRLD